MVYNIRNASSDRIIHRSDLKDELQTDIEFIDNLDHVHLKPFVDLLLESDSTLTYSKTYNFVEKLLRDQLEGSMDLCHVNTDNWDFRLGWEAEKQKYDSQIAEAINAMTS